MQVPKSKLDRAITKYPLLLGGSCTRTFQPIVQAINAVGVKSRRLGGVIADSPNLLLRAPREFQQVCVGPAPNACDGTRLKPSWVWLSIFVVTVESHLHPRLSLLNGTPLETGC